MKMERLTNNLEPCQEWTEKLILRSEDLSSTDRALRDSHVQTCSACQSVLEDYRSLKKILEISPPMIMPLPRLADPLYEEQGSRKVMKSLLPHPVVARVIVGLLIGAFFLFLVSRFVSLVASIGVVIQNLV